MKLWSFFITNENSKKKQLSYRNSGTSSYRVDGRHWLPTAKTKAAKFKPGRKFDVGICIVCNRKKSINVNNKTIEAEESGLFFKLGKIFLVMQFKKHNCNGKSRMSFQNRRKNECAAVSRYLRAVLYNIPDVLNFHHTGREIYLEKVV